MDLNRTYDFPAGEVLLIDKPLQWTSFDVVNKIRHMLRHHLRIKKIKVGHAGTLDPLASGLLLVCVGKATKRINEYSGLDKEYAGTFYIGGTTPSFDLETEADYEYDTSHITEKLIKETAKIFEGRIKQVPPVYSAVKIDGKRAYLSARKKEDLDIPAREVFIHEFEIIKAGVPETEFRVSCSKGTYIRTLANDFGKALKSGAYVQSLRRTQIGDYHINDSITIPEFEEYLNGLLNM
jgi:tRNA pseudouridine55 synthase